MFLCVFETIHCTEQETTTRENYEVTSTCWLSVNTCWYYVVLAHSRNSTTS